MMRLSYFAMLAALLALAGCGNAPQLPSPDGARPAPAPTPSGKPRQEPGVPVLPPAGSGRGGYYQDDGPGDNPPPNLMQTPDAEVRNDPPIPRSNRPYVVFGKTYTPITDTDTPFVQRGLGTWYGKKFHGQRTSSGELYDMYKMTAAHPTLPIPSYARVTNLDNGNQVVVRINDRGPFHSTRVIDVSYTAALKLGLLGKGSHQLEVERILPAEAARLAAGGKPRTSAAIPQGAPRQGVQKIIPPAVAPAPQRPVAHTAALLYPPPPASAPDAGAQAGPIMAAPLIVTPDPAQADGGVMLAGGSVSGASAAAMPAVGTPPAAQGGFYLQLGAYSRAENAESARAKVAMETSLFGLEVVPSGAVLRLYSGPYATRQEAAQAMQALPPALGLKPLVIQR
ncbi:septal ring lytic transglycosylase RlpA family protein [Pseudoduganella namucuonensis]|uniref:Endolytic peptidoglycan transglycosylase RlpA n=1 Tax=Pseudoduganella namucuonensis TaxID=1035707 RepID=A0A1I7ETF7_9BURK|nr:septal ring lytic transglycosylase RlpA family protein [Pseudoduganella namucuonensis]SFU27201.1 rare lipoprotein A [Pseudoduganella namucuonensis]